METELTLKKAFELAQAIEMAEKDTRDLVASQGQNIVNHVRKSGAICHMNYYRCKRQHDPATCKFKEAKWLCKNWTHFKGFHEQEATNSTSYKFQGIACGTDRCESHKSTTTSR